MVYKLTSEQLNFLTEQTNRSNSQTEFLFQLVDGDFEKLKELETKLKKYWYCPGDKEEVTKILNNK